MPCMPGAAWMLPGTAFKGKAVAPPQTMPARTSRISGFLGLQRNTVGVLAMVVLVGMAERFVPIYLIRDVFVSLAALGGAFLWQITPQTNPETFLGSRAVVRTNRARARAD